MTAETYDFSYETIPSMLEHLRCLAHDSLPLDSPHAQKVKEELDRRGLSVTMTDKLIDLARTLEENGAKISFDEKKQRRPGGMRLTISLDR